MKNERETYESSLAHAVRDVFANNNQSIFDAVRAAIRKDGIWRSVERVETNTIDRPVSLVPDNGYILPGWWNIESVISQTSNNGEKCFKVYVHGHIEMSCFCPLLEQAVATM